MARLILVADDSPTVQRRAQGILQGEGFEVETVSNGVAAIKKLPKLQPVLVLADVSMPGKDGYEVCDYVKSSADLHHVPVLLVGSDLEPYDQQRGAQVGADGIIKKPFTPDELVAMVVKFTGPGEAPAPPSTLPGTLSTSSVSLQSAPEAQPHAWEQSLPESRPAAPPENVLGSWPGTLLAPAEQSAGFAPEPTPEPTSEPTPAPASEGAPEFPVASRELISEPAPEGMLEALLAAPEPSLEGIPEAASEPAWQSAQMIPEPAPETEVGPTLAVPEPTPTPVTEALPEPALVVPEPTPAPLAEAVPEPLRVGPELISEPAPEAALRPALVVPEPTPEPVAEAVSELARLSPEFIPETAAEAGSEPVSAMMEPAAESGLPFLSESATEPVHAPAEAAPEARPAGPAEEVPPPTEPFLTEKQVEPIAPLPMVAEFVTPEADRTGEFFAPAEMAGPVLIDELASAPAAPELHPLVEEKNLKRKVATSLNGFSLAEAAEGQVYVAPTEIELGPPPEAEAVQPGGAPASTPPVVGREWVYVVVRKAVLKMAPPALPPELVEELIRMLTQEIASELNASSQAY